MNVMVAMPQSSEPDFGGAVSAVERQRRYRVARDIRSIDLPGSTVEALQVLRGRTGLTNQQLLLRALSLLTDDLDHPASAAPSSPALTVAGTSIIELDAPDLNPPEARPTPRMSRRNAPKVRGERIPTSTPELSPGDVPGPIHGAPSDVAAVLPSDRIRPLRKSPVLPPISRQIGFDFNAPVVPTSAAGPSPGAASRKHRRT